MLQLFSLQRQRTSPESVVQNSVMDSELLELILSFNANSDVSSDDGGDAANHDDSLGQEMPFCNLLACEKAVVKCTQYTVLALTFIELCCKFPCLTGYVILHLNFSFTNCYFLSFFCIYFFCYIMSSNQICGLQKRLLGCYIKFFKLKTMQIPWLFSACQ